VLPDDIIAIDHVLPDDVIARNDLRSGILADAAIRRVAEAGHRVDRVVETFICMLKYLD
jgi:hypothetical protein